MAVVAIEALADEPATRRKDILQAIADLRRTRDELQSGPGNEERRLGDFLGAAREAIRAMRGAGVFAPSPAREPHPALSAAYLQLQRFRLQATPGDLERLDEATASAPSRARAVLQGGNAFKLDIPRSADEALEGACTLAQFVVAAEELRVVREGSDVEDLFIILSVDATSDLRASLDALGVTAA